MDVKKLSILQSIYKLQRVDLFEASEVKSTDFAFNRNISGYTYKTIEVVLMEVVNTATGKMIKINGNNEYLFPVVNNSTAVKTNEDWFDNEEDANNFVIAVNKMEAERVKNMITELNSKLKVLDDLTDRSIHVKK